MTVATKRAYEKPVASDGQRVLVDRLWPRGVKKEQARVDCWLKNLAPSDALRKWFHANADWMAFKKRYFQELAGVAATADLESLYDLLLRYPKVTLVYASRDQRHNNAVALKELLEGMRKPPSSSGPVRHAAVGRSVRRRPGR
jgi:uncharacterized protein YeaO (DUF488 family)